MSKLGFEERKFRGVFLAMALGGVWSCQQAPSRAESARLLYEDKCALCHGMNGDGQGDAAYLLQPKPRKFRAGQFRLVSTQNLVPTRQDIFDTITNGMPGTGMPSWAHLPEDQRWVLSDYVMELNRAGWYELAIQEMASSDAEAQAYADRMTHPGELVTVPPEPPVTEDGLEEGREYYVLACAKCHGENGEGMRDPTWQTSEGYPTWARNLREGVFKGGREGSELFVRFATGLPGTPMPSQTFNEEQTWRIVQYVQTFSDPQAQERAQIRTVEIRVPGVERLPSGPEDVAWENVSEVRVPLMPLWWRENYVQAVRVKAVHAGARLALRIEWDDPTSDTGGIRQNHFTDGVAVELAAGDSPPLFAMGATGQPVNIWHWKALWTEDQSTFQDVGTVFPRVDHDGYYGSEQGWGAAPFDDPTYRPAAELDNFVASPERGTEAEDANAAGLGTLTAQSFPQQNVHAVSERTDGGWRVQFDRDMNASGDNDVLLAPGRPISVAFAVWDGSVGDRNGQKTASIWNPLVVQQP